MAGPEFHIRGHWWLEGPGGLEVGPGRAELLRRIAELGSIRQAAMALGMSYRQAWGQVRAMNESSPSPLVERQTGGTAGGGASLTELGQQTLALYEKASERCTRFMEEPLR